MQKSCYICFIGLLKLCSGLICAGFDGEGMRIVNHIPCTFNAQVLHSIT